MTSTNYKLHESTTLVVGTMSSMAVDVPYTMLSSLLPVGVSHRYSPQTLSFDESMAVETGSWYSGRWDHE